MRFKKKSCLKRFSTSRIFNYINQTEVKLFFEAHVMKAHGEAEVQLKAFLLNKTERAPETRKPSVSNISVIQQYAQYLMINFIHNIQ